MELECFVKDVRMNSIVNFETDWNRENRDLLKKSVYSMECSVMMFVLAVNVYNMNKIFDDTNVQYTDYECFSESNE